MCCCGDAIETSCVCSSDTIELMSLDCSVASVVQFDGPKSCEDWIRSIQRNITAQNNLSVSLFFFAQHNCWKFVYRWICKFNVFHKCCKLLRVMSCISRSNLKCCALLLLEHGTVCRRMWHCHQHWPLFIKDWKRICFANLILTLFLNLVIFFSPYSGFEIALLLRPL